VYLTGPTQHGGKVIFQYIHFLKHFKKFIVWHTYMKYRMTPVWGHSTFSIDGLLQSGVHGHDQVLCKDQDHPQRQLRHLEQGPDGAEMGLELSRAQPQPSLNLFVVFPYYWLRKCDKFTFMYTAAAPNEKYNRWTVKFTNREQFTMHLFGYYSKCRLVSITGREILNFFDQSGLSSCIVL
jgi:hypothetical protein